MVSIDINGMKIEAETLKEAQKLARKEEKRQAKEREEKYALHQKALIQCYANIGKITLTIIRDSCFILGDATNGLIKEEEGTRSLYMESLNGQSTYVPLGSKETVEAIFCSNIGTLAVKIRHYFKENDYNEQWETYGIEDGEVACVSLPDSVKTTLDTFLAIDKEHTELAA